MRVSFKAALGLIASFVLATLYNACSNVSFLGSNTSILNQETVGGNPLTRPAYNLGLGFYVLGGKLYDANNVEFRMRGVDKTHWDEPSLGLANSNANTVRWSMDLTQAPGKNVALLQGGKGKTAGTIYNQMVVMPYTDSAPATPSSPSGTLSCSNDPTLLQSAVNMGQDIADITNYAQAVFDSDPEKNTIFDLHIYGGSFYDSAGGIAAGAGQQDLGPTLLALSKVGLVINIGEFGPGRNIGPSPTLISPTRVIQAAEAAQLGWLAWSWDDNNRNAGQSDNKWFSMSYTGNYNSSSDLTIYGQQVVEGCTNPAPSGCGCPDSPAPAMNAIAPLCAGTPQPAYTPYSLKALAVPATIFN